MCFIYVSSYKWQKIDSKLVKTRGSGVKCPLVLLVLLTHTPPRPYTKTSIGMWLACGNHQTEVSLTSNVKVKFPIVEKSNKILPIPALS